MKRNWKVPIVVMLPEDEIELIDKERKGTPRSEYLRTIILNRNKKKA